MAACLAFSNESQQPKYDASYVLDIYTNKGQDIFQKNHWYEISKPKYTSQGRKQVLQTYFNDYTMRHTLTKIAIPAIIRNN